MKHLPFVATPIDEMQSFSKELGCNLLCKRDDLFMSAYGGNKARMLQYILQKLTESKYDVLVTAGPKSSNFNRACALMCAKLGILLHIVVYSSDENEDEKSLNYKLCNFSNVVTTSCLKENVASTIKQVVSSYGKKSVLSVYGGGRSLEGVYAYYEAVGELHNQIKSIDHIFVACGTGTTLTGIAAGAQRWFPNAIVHGISISRNYSEEYAVLNEDMLWLNDYLGSQYDFSNLEYTDKYLCGGYGLYDDKIMENIQKVISNEGLILDPCYSGKAWHGMMTIIDNDKDRYKGKNVLFWHTGGMLNLLSIL